MTNCARCGKQTLATIMSMFNTDIICLDCKDKEKQDPRYKQAVEAENAAVLRGDYNFRGIGR
jgi:hypothetical protein